MLKIDKNNIAKIRDSICRTCKFAENCIHFDSSTGPIFECDSFENSDRDLYCEYADCDKIDHEVEKAMGLCQTCKHVKDCVHAKKGEFKWHCEDYE